MRLRFSDGTLVTKAALSSITFTVKDTADLSQTGTGTLTVNTVISDTLSTVGWEEDVVGWNFSASLAPSYFPEADKLYVVEYTITPASGYAQTVSTYVRTLAEDEE
jgi:hypothetical protein